MATSMAPVGMAVGQDLPAFLKASRPQARQGFARLPDRGDLMGYPTRRVVRADGAYTWYRADLSEAHALRAVADGRMRVTMPDGSAVDFRYERHVEHPSGDWTWVGHAMAGRTSDEIVVTFGDKAAFGTIARPGRTPLNLVMRDGASWLVEADPAKVAQIVNPATRPTAPDFLLPPPMAAARGLAGTAASAPVAAAAAANASTTVDVVLGYTPGFASSVGGQSQAVTRLNFLVDVTNEAYVNSQVDARVRLVHTLQVDYADATDNGDTLEALTGYKSGTGTIPVPAALQPLRAARDQYGGDLVSLVRKFNTPENDGCGIAWLIGGGRTTIDGNDAPFGYSVVSDGQDAGTDGKTYFCRQETLGHEMGHNMGLQHDRNTADGSDNVLQDGEYGAFTYSFGHKTAAGAGNFYTVMAYGDSGQTPYRIFSNPRVSTCGGFACGIADAADNARALSQTMPLIAGFRAQVVPQASRPNIYAISKLGLSGRTEVHVMSGESTYQSFLLNAATPIATTGSDFAWRYVVADFTRDGTLDLMAIGRSTGSGRTDVHVLNGATTFQAFSLNAATALGSTGTTDNWQFDAGDFNGDGFQDLYAFYRTGASGKTEVHVLNGANGFQSFLLNTASAIGATGNNASWMFKVGDWNRDGTPDVFAIARSGASGKVEVHVLDGRNLGVFLLNRATGLNAVAVNYASDFELADYDGDGILDLMVLLKSGASGRVEVHVLTGASSFASFGANIATALSAVPTNNSWEFEGG